MISQSGITKTLSADIHHSHVSGIMHMCKSNIEVPGRVTRTIRINANDLSGNTYNQAERQELSGGNDP